MKQIIAVVLSQFLTFQVQDCQTMYPPSSNTEELDIEMHTFGLLNTTKVHPRAVFSFFSWSGVIPGTPDSSDRVGALSRSNNDTVDSEDVDSISLGILPEL